MRGLGETERAVAPVIAHVLLVVIVIVIASTVAVFSFGLGEDIIDPTPSVVFETEQEADVVRITHIGGDTIDGERITIHGGNVSGEKPDTLQVGDTVEIEPDPAADEVVILWEDGQKSFILVKVRINGNDTTD